ncbi:MAG: sugar phosphate isomerase/epimerase [Candidatus Hydrogenedentes bacterium]|nr:sugar phosphate isomerase/epimerase [Candidatus Hydrogenedentota bacterium]
MTLKISLALSIFSEGADRYCLDGYRESPRVQERIAAAAKLRQKGVKAVELEQTDITAELSSKEMKRILKDYNLSCSAVVANLARDRRFALGAFGNQHQKTRNAAIDEGRKAADVARAVGASCVCLRLYSDGFDYPFQVDYGAHWNSVISSIKTIAKYAAPDINVAIAYKPRDPRQHLTVATVGKSLSLCQEIAMKNVGVAMNFSHAMMAGENPAESIAFLTRASKLFNCYVSDCYGMWDDAMIPGSIHTWELLEALFYLKTSKHKGFLTIDMFPRQMEPSHACQIAVGNLSIFWKKLERLDTSEMRRAQKSLDAVESQRIIRRVMLQG